MKYRVVRKNYSGDSLINSVELGIYDTNEKADNAICDDVSEFREYHDNDERIDWNVVEVTDDIGNSITFKWTVEEVEN